jgi:hypothetical protein
MKTRRNAWQLAAQEVIQQMGAQADMNFLQSVHDLCYTQVRNEEVLTEFEIRKNAYRQQQAQGPWLLGLVLVITLSGVLLAAVQLFWGYKLSAAGKAVAGRPGRRHAEPHADRSFSEFDRDGSADSGAVVSRSSTSLSSRCMSCMSRNRRR